MILIMPSLIQWICHCSLGNYCKMWGRTASMATKSIGANNKFKCCWISKMNHKRLRVEMIPCRNVSEFRWKTQNALPPGRFMVFQLWRKFPGKFSGPPFNFQGNLFSKLIQIHIQNCKKDIWDPTWICSIAITI